MEIKRKALGRGIEELLGNGELDFAKFEEAVTNNTPKNEIVEISLDELRSNPYQPRKVFDEEKLQELSLSIKEHGVFQPIIVKKSSIKGYEIVAGERRVIASRMANLKTIPAIIKDLTDEEMMQIALLENLQRENLNSIEEAMAYEKLIENLDLTHEELAKRVGKSRSYITNIIGLLNLPENVRKMVIDKKISSAHARILSKLESITIINELAKKCETENISVRELEELVKKGPFDRKKTQIRQNRNEYYELEESFSEKLGTKVKIKKNKIEISFANVNDLNRLIEIMGLNND